jgi:hypothetical protein
MWIIIIWHKLNCIHQPMCIGNEPGDIVDLIIWHSEHVSVHVCEAVVSPWHQSATKLIHYIHIHAIEGCLATKIACSHISIHTRYCVYNIDMQHLQVAQLYSMPAARN